MAECPYLRRTTVLLLLATLACFAAKVHTGKVVGIADGDTLTLLIGNKPLKIRLAEIDAPERRQPYGTKAKHALSDLAFGKSARVVEIDRDRYGRIVGQVYVGDPDINTELVRQGYVWVYRKYPSGRSCTRSSGKLGRLSAGYGRAGIRCRLGNGGISGNLAGA